MTYVTAPTVRRATRSADDRYVGGVSAGLARHLEVDVRYVRLAFVVASALGGLGLFLYAGLWMTMPLASPDEPSSPGLEAAARQGRRPAAQPILRDAGPGIAIGVTVLGVAMIFNALFGGSALFWPIVFAVFGLVLLWRQADEAQRQRWTDPSGRFDVVGTVVGEGGIAAYARLAAGVGLLVTALVVFAVQTGKPQVARDVLLAGVLGVLGLALTLGPWLFRLVAALSEERAERVRSQERADVAAHLHDSVLQTLALIQKHADDPRAVTTLARAQERDLRQWLFGAQRPDGTTLAEALRAAAAEIESAHGMPVEVVTVGDVPLGDRTSPLLQAAREAIVNAAKHSGADKVDVYAEFTGTEAAVFVRDRGNGYDESAVPEDRLGVRNSIIARMERHGGTAEIRTGPGEGTEVRLRMGLRMGPTEEETA